jgi:hypothetical protein
MSWKLTAGSLPCDCGSQPTSLKRLLRACATLCTESQCLDGGESGIRTKFNELISERATCVLINLVGSYF